MLIRQLVAILNNEELSEIITWHPNGNGFTVLDKIRLVNEVLPMYFKEAKFSSFNRRLKRWNFSIQRHGHKMSSYFHPNFKRGDVKSILKISPSLVPTQNNTVQLASAERTVTTSNDSGTTDALLGRHDAMGNKNNRKRPSATSKNKMNHELALGARTTSKDSMVRTREGTEAVPLLQSFRSLQQPCDQKEQLTCIPMNKNTAQMMVPVTPYHDQIGSASPPFCQQPLAVQEAPHSQHRAGVIVPPPSLPSSGQMLCDYHNSVNIPCTARNGSSSIAMLMHQAMYQHGTRGHVGPLPGVASHVAMLPASNNNGHHLPYFSSSPATTPSVLSSNPMGSVMATNPSLSAYANHPHKNQNKIPGSLLSTCLPNGSNTFPMFAPTASSSVPTSLPPETALANYGPVIYHHGEGMAINRCFPPPSSGMMVYQQYANNRNDLVVVPPYHQQPQTTTAQSAPV